MLIPVYEGRPAIVWVGNVPVYVSIHDSEHQRRRDEWKRKLRAHPDTGGTSLKFIDVRAAFDRWMAKEEKWYAAHGIRPPRHGELRQISETSVPRVLKSRPRKLSTMRVYGAKRYRERLAGVAQGLCFRCQKPRGENGTSKHCRPCADVRAAQARKHKTRKKASNFTRFYHERVGVKAHTSVLTSKEEKLIWASLAEKRRMSISQMVRLAMRRQYGYAVPAVP